MPSARQTLADTFGFQAFRPGQERVVQAIVDGCSALAVFPTGGGKSLCYQLPALLIDGLTLVVSPLIALMKDQVDHLQALGVSAERLDSTRTSEQVRDIYGRMAEGSLQLLYVAPERLGNRGFRRRLAQTRIGLLAVDEAHCISEWGHNFRPDYLKLAEAVRDLGIPRVLALTATATPQVSRDICRAFAIQPRHHVQTGFHRPNLALRVERCAADARTERLVALVRGGRGATVVYVTLQKTAERVAQALVEAGVLAAAYHAGMTAPDRARIQDAFMADELRVVVATIAFGMGIDKADIRAVYHYNLPKSLEGYSQQVGRAGRDGRPSECVTLGCADDLTVLQNFTYGDTPTPEALRAFVDTLLAPASDPIAVSRYQLSRDLDLRPLVVATALTYLELDGRLVSLGPFYDRVQVRFKRSEDEVLSAFSGERQAFLRGLFDAGRRGRTWLTLEVTAAAAALGEDRGRVQRALNWMEQQGWIATKVSQLRHAYRRDPTLDAEATAQSLVVRFEARERSDLARTEQIRAFVEHDGCLTHRLVGHFGEALDGRCGHCGPCFGEPSGPLPRTAPVELNAGHYAVLDEVLRLGEPLLAHPRALARFLCGLSSPAFSGRGGLSRHRRFGVLGELPFARVLEAAQQATSRVPVQPAGR